MADSIDTDAILRRFQERAKAGKKRNLPPVGGDERQMFLRQAEEDFFDYSLLADATAQVNDGILTFSIDLRPPAE